MSECGQLLATKDWAAESVKQDIEEGYSSDEEGAPAEAEAVEIVDLEDIGGVVAKNNNVILPLTAAPW